MGPISSSVNDVRFNAAAVLRTRLTRGLSREELADLVGVSRQSVHAYETGVTAPRPARALRIAEVLDIDPADMWQVAS